MVKSSASAGPSHQQFSRKSVSLVFPVCQGTRSSNTGSLEPDSLGTESGEQPNVQSTQQLAIAVCGCKAGLYGRSVC